MTEDLIGWLRSQLDAEEQEARAADTGQPWKAITNGQHGPQVRVDAGLIDDPDAGWNRDVNYQVWHCDDEADGCPEAARGWIAEAKHIARHDPARVLREVEAKRALIAETICPYLGADTTTGRVAWLALRLLALPYSDRPGYREEWRPT